MAIRRIHRLSTYLLALCCCLISFETVLALPCECNSGKLVESAPQCRCECLEGYQLPDCDYKIDDTVRLDIYIDLPPSAFSSTSLAISIEQGTLLSSNEVVFQYASSLSAFNKTNVLMTMPGYGVRRFIPMVQSREIWVQEAKIESAYVIPYPAAPLAETSRFPTFSYNGATITAEGWSWLGGALTVTLLVCIIDCCCLKNTEDIIMDIEDEEMHSSKFQVKSVFPSTGSPTERRNPLSSSFPTNGSPQGSMNKNGGYYDMDDEEYRRHRAAKKKKRAKEHEL